MNPPPLSQSALSAFDRCRRRFYLRFVRRLEWPAPLTGSEQEWERSRRRGERFHLLVQQDALGLPADEIARASGDEELTAWWERFRRHPPPPPGGPSLRVHTELELEVVLTGGQPLVARFDRLEISGDSGGARLDIVDWKTGAPSSREHLERSWQTAVYRFVALEGAGSLAPGTVAAEGIRFVYWQSALPEEPVVLHYDAGQHEQARQRIEAAAAEIEERLRRGRRDSRGPRTSASAVTVRTGPTATAGARPGRVWTSRRRRKARRTAGWCRPGTRSRGRARATIPSRSTVPQPRQDPAQHGMKGALGAGLGTGRQ